MRSKQKKKEEKKSSIKAIKKFPFSMLKRREREGDRERDRERGSKEIINFIEN